MTQEPETESPSELVRRALSEYEGLLVGYTKGIVLDLELARDIVQDTFIKLFEQEPGRITPSGLKAWLVTVCRNKALDALRRNRKIVSMDEEKLRDMPSQDLSPSETAAQNEETAEVMRFLQRLPENQREVLRLKFQLDLSYREISQTTGLSVSNVGFLIHTGIKRLRQLLVNSFEETEDAVPMAASKPSLHLSKQAPCPTH